MTIHAGTTMSMTQWSRIRRVNVGSHAIVFKTLCFGPFTLKCSPGVFKLKRGLQRIFEGRKLRRSVIFSQWCLFQSMVEKELISMKTSHSTMFFIGEKGSKRGNKVVLRMYSLKTVHWKLLKGIKIVFSGITVKTSFGFFIFKSL